MAPSCPALRLEGHLTIDCLLHMDAFWQRTSKQQNLYTRHEEAYCKTWENLFCYCAKFDCKSIG